MLNRIVKPLKTNSFFLFGARGTGKSTFLQNYITDRALVFDLLDDEVFDDLLKRPKMIEDLAGSKKHEWIVLNEVQRLPHLLNVVPRMIEKTGQKFALTGSSSRKLKRGSANLLAGRAFIYSMFPFSYLELGESFDLNEVLRWGSLPQLLSLKTPEEKKLI
jgi:predicted AAA+ superfamily ATPase